MMGGVVQPDDLGRISLCDVEMPHVRLQDAPALRPDDPRFSEPLRRFVEDLDEDEIPSSWLVLVDEPDRAVVGGLLAGAEEDPGDGSPDGLWAVAEITRKPLGWTLRRGCAGPQPLPTRRAKGRGLILKWPAEVLQHRVGAVPRLHLTLQNTSTGPWDDPEGRDLVAFVRLEDADGRPLPGSLRHVVGVGRHHHLAPGGIKEVTR